MKSKTILITVAALVVMGLMSVFAFSSPCAHMGDKSMASIEKAECCVTAANSEACKTACEESKAACCDLKEKCAEAQGCDHAKVACNDMKAHCCDSDKAINCPETAKKDCGTHKN